MKTNLVRVIAAAFMMTVASAQLMASNNNNNNDPAEGFEIIQTSQVAPVIEQVELTYEQKAKQLGAEMVEGFIATGYTGITWGLTKLSAFTAGQLYGADTLTEAYLLLGKEVTGEGADLDLNNLQAVYKFLTETSADKFGKRLDQASSLIGKEGAISYAPTIISTFLKYYSPKRIGEALNYIYMKNLAKYGDQPLPLDEGKADGINQNINNNNNEEKK